MHVEYVPSVFGFKKPETKKRTSSDIERYERQKKRKKVKELFHKQSKQPVEAAEGEFNLVAEEETHKDKICCLFLLTWITSVLLLSFLIFRSTLIAALKTFFVVVL